MGYEARNPVSQKESRVLCFLDKNQSETYPFFLVNCSLIIVNGKFKKVKKLMASHFTIS